MQPSIKSVSSCNVNINSSLQCKNPTTKPGNHLSAMCATEHMVDALDFSHNTEHIDEINHVKD